MRYIVIVLLLFVTGCNDHLVSRQQLSALSAQQLTSYQESTKPSIAPSLTPGQQRELLFHITSGEILVNSVLEVVIPVKAHIKEGECQSLLLVSKSHARVLRACFDNEKIRIGTGVYVRSLNNPLVLLYGLDVQNFLTDEEEGIYSLSMYLHVT